MPESGRVHLAYLEGVRGWAAVFVALHHIWQFVVMRPDLGAVPPWFTLTAFFKFGGYAVPVFIVLSGYCLMLPVVRSGRAELSGGVRKFAQRRARRILIPYYAALGLTLLLIACYPRLSQQTFSQWDTALPALSVASVVSHVLLVHNWFAHLQWTIDPPMWSVATEWQNYFVFALVLLPLWRRFSALTTLALAFALGLSPMLLGYGFASPWFLGLFACGMFAAAINFDPACSFGPEKPLTWEKAGAVFGVLVAVITVANSKLHAFIGPHPLPDILVGFGMTCFLVATTRRLQFGMRSTLLARFLEHPVSMKLGEFSYSIYLIHYPIIAVVYLPLLDERLGPVQMFAALVAGALPLALLVAYGFHRVFEKPFMRRPGRETLRATASLPDTTADELNSAVR
ncbi:MAG TPA: acyltransferase [Polyangiaceae bacterium]|nr:acyltransferase [Polyangiaceae bacterium]